MVKNKPKSFYDIEKSVRISLDNLMKEKCAKFQVDWMKIVQLILPADLKNMVLRKTRQSCNLKKIIKFFCTLQDKQNKSLWPNYIKKKISCLKKFRNKHLILNPLQWCYPLMLKAFKHLEFLQFILWEFLAAEYKYGIQICDFRIFKKVEFF